MDRWATWIHKGGKTEEKPFSAEKISVAVVGAKKERKGALIIENKGEDKEKQKETV